MYVRIAFVCIAILQLSVVDAMEAPAQPSLNNFVAHLFPLWSVLHQRRCSLKPVIHEQPVVPIESFAALFESEHIREGVSLTTIEAYLLKLQKMATILEGQQYLVNELASLANFAYTALQYTPDHRVAYNIASSKTISAQESMAGGAPEQEFLSRVSKIMQETEEDVPVTTLQGVYALYTFYMLQQRKVQGISSLETIVNMASLKELGESSDKQVSDIGKYALAYFNQAVLHKRIFERYVQIMVATGAKVGEYAPQTVEEILSYAVGGELLKGLDSLPDQVGQKAFDALSPYYRPLCNFWDFLVKNFEVASNFHFRMFTADQMKVLCTSLRETSESFTAQAAVYERNYGYLMKEMNRVMRCVSDEEVQSRLRDQYTVSLLMHADGTTFLPRSLGKLHPLCKVPYDQVFQTLKTVVPSDIAHTVFPEVKKEEKRKQKKKSSPQSRKTLVSNRAVKTPAYTKGAHRWFTSEFIQKRKPDAATRLYHTFALAVDEHLKRYGTKIPLEEVYVHVPATVSYMPGALQDMEGGFKSGIFINVCNERDRIFHRGFCQQPLPVLCKSLVENSPYLAFLDLEEDSKLQGQAPLSKPQAAHVPPGYEETAHYIQLEDPVHKAHIMLFKSLP